MEDETGESNTLIAEFVCEEAYLRWRRSGGTAEWAREHLEREQYNATGVGPGALDDEPSMAATAFEAVGRQMVGGVLNGVLVIPQANKFTIALSLGAVPHTF